MERASSGSGDLVLGAQSPAGAEAGSPRRDALVAGVVAYNEDRTLRSAVESLLTQELPEGAGWAAILVVASGCTDRTEEIGRALERRHPEVRLIVEPERRGKASALNEVVRRSRGRRTVLLNADARAEPGAVRALLAEAATSRPPFAVMGRPVVASDGNRSVVRTAGLLWALHDEFHRTSIGSGSGNHLSDELLLLDAPGFEGFPPGTINDGSYLGAWLEAQGGELRYALDAQVAIQLPGTWQDHLTQRRRILQGHAQVHDLLGRSPSTMSQLLVTRPFEAARILARVLRRQPDRALDLAALAGPEILANLLARWDRWRHRTPTGGWERIRRPVAWP